MRSTFIGNMCLSNCSFIIIVVNIIKYIFLDNYSNKYMKVQEIFVFPNIFRQRCIFWCEQNNLINTLLPLHTATYKIVDI